MKDDLKSALSAVIAIASILAILLVMQFRSVLSVPLTTLFVIIFFIVGMISGFSYRIYTKPRFRGLGLRDDKEVEEDEREMEEPYYHH